MHLSLKLIWHDHNNYKYIGRLFYKKYVKYIVAEKSPRFNDKKAVQEQHFPPKTFCL